MLKLNPDASSACNRAVVISGAGRSGTTILGQVIHSMEGVEYCFEGPMLVSLFPLIELLQRDQWMLLYETYLYEEFLINALAGRNLNCNRADDSSIYKVKPDELVESRFVRSRRKRDLVLEARGSIIAYTLPDIVPYLNTLTSYYPGSRVVVLYRRAEDTLNSVLQKKWFADDTIKDGLIHWPNRTVRGMPIPYFVPEADSDYWLSADELHRSAYYYVRMMDNLRTVENAIVLNYDRMLGDPQQTINALASRLDLAFGPKTAGLVASIRKTASPRVEVLSRLDPSMQKRLKVIADAFD
jgi:hypothetical protein